MNRANIEVMIQRYTEAGMVVLDGKTVRFNGQGMTMKNLSEIRRGRQEWECWFLSLISHRHGRLGHRLARFG